MKVTIDPDANGQGVYTIQWPDTQLRFYLVQRDSNFDSKGGAVYILMDKYRRGFYIGETGPSRNGGVFNRFQTHKWEKKFWDCALVICDDHGSFKQDDVRRWFEWQLNVIAKKANTAVVLSTAGAQDEPFGVRERLSAILSVCRFIGISWAFEIEPDALPETGKIGERGVRSVAGKSDPSVPGGRDRSTGSKFIVKFADGVVMADKQARLVLARSIEKLGAAEVAKLGIMLGGEPLVTRDKSLFVKCPRAVVEIKGGWFVKTHSNTVAKMNCVQKIAKALKVKVIVERVADPE